MGYRDCQWLKLPNLLTLSRIVIVPFFVYAYLSPNGQLLSSVLLVLSGISDMLDGFLARRLNLVTYLGKMLDPIADKLTQLAILCCLSLRYPLFPLLLVVFLVKELLTLAAGVILYRKKIEICGAKWFGKLATCFFYVSSIAIVLFPMIPISYVNVAILVNLVLFVFAFVRYVPVFFALKNN